MKGNLAGGPSIALVPVIEYTLKPARGKYKTLQEIDYMARLKPIAGVTMVVVYLPDVGNEHPWNITLQPPQTFNGTLAVSRSPAWWSHLGTSYSTGEAMPQVA